MIELDNLDQLPDLSATPIDPLNKRLEVDGPVLVRELPVRIEDGDKNNAIMQLLGYCRRHGANATLMRSILGLYLRAGLIDGGDQIEGRWITDAVRSMASRPAVAREGREYIRWSEAQLEHIVSVIAEKLGASGEVFQRAGRLSYIGRDDEKNLLLREYHKKAMCVLIPRVAEITAVKKDEEYEIGAPDKCVDVLFSSPMLWDAIPVCKGIAQCPILRRDGSVLDTPGYDEASGYYFAPGDVVWPKVPEAPTRADAVEALWGVIWATILKDYKFVRPEHASVALAIPLTILGRVLFDGPTPLFLIDSPVKGSGKSLLAKAWGYVITGRAPPVAGLMNGAETEKRCTGYLLDAAQMVVFDDIKTDIGAEGVLDRLITATVWGGRILGKTGSVAVANLTCWIATGNNVTIGGDMERRTILCRVDPGVPDPAAIKGLPDLIRVILEKRPQLVCAFNTIWRAYILAGKPQADLQGYGSFEGWSIVRHLLVWLGLPDPVLTRAEVRERSDVVGSAVNQFIALFAVIYRYEPQSARDIMRTCAMAKDAQALDLKDALVAMGAYDDRGNTTAVRLGRVLSKIADRQIENLVFSKKIVKGKCLYFVKIR